MYRFFQKLIEEKLESKRIKNNKLLLDLFYKLYSGNLSEISREINLMWTVCILYLTTVLPGTLIIISNSTEITTSIDVYNYLLLALPLIHIGWSYGTLLKTLDLQLYEENGRYLETRINKLLDSMGIDIREYKVIRYTDLKKKLQGSYIDKPLKHIVSGYLSFFWFIPIILFVIIITFLIIVGIRFPVNETYELIVMIVSPIYVGIQTVIFIVYLKALKRMRNEATTLINEDN